MKSFTEKCIRFSIIILTLGIVIIAIAYSLGGRINNLPSNKVTNFTETYSGVESLILELDASEVEIITGGAFKIEATNILKNNFKSYVENGNWYIEDKTSVRHFNFGSNHSKVVIYIPESFAGKKLDIKIGAGKLTASKLTAYKTSIEVGAGDLQAYNLVTDELDLECGVGNVEINGVVSNSGKVECGIGNVTLDLKGNEKDYNYDISVGIGKVTLNGSNFGGFGNKVIDNVSEDKKFTIECGIGKVSLNINE